MADREGSGQNMGTTRTDQVETRSRRRATPTPAQGAVVSAYYTPRTLQQGESGGAHGGQRQLRPRQSQGLSPVTTGMTNRRNRNRDLQEPNDRASQQRSSIDEARRGLPNSAPSSRTVTTHNARVSGQIQRTPNHSLSAREHVSRSIPPDLRGLMAADNPESTPTPGADTFHAIATSIPGAELIHAIATGNASGPQLGCFILLYNASNDGELRKVVSDRIATYLAEDKIDLAERLIRWINEQNGTIEFLDIVSHRLRTYTAEGKTDLALRLILLVNEISTAKRKPESTLSPTDVADILCLESGVDLSRLWAKYKALRAGSTPRQQTRQEPARTIPQQQAEHSREIPFGQASGSRPLSTSRTRNSGRSQPIGLTRETGGSIAGQNRPTQPQNQESAPPRDRQQRGSARPRGNTPPRELLVEWGGDSGDFAPPHQHRDDRSPRDPPRECADLSHRQRNRTPR